MLNNTPPVRMDRVQRRAVQRSLLNFNIFFFLLQPPSKTRRLLTPSHDIADAWYYLLADAELLGLGLTV